MRTGCGEIRTFTGPALAVTRNLTCPGVVPAVTTNATCPPESGIGGPTVAVPVLEGSIASATGIALVSGVPCQFLLDSVAVRIDTYRSYQPDALIYCGQPVPGDAVEVPNPVVVVEILSPSNAMKDLRDKLVGYFRVPSVVHYLIVDPDDRLVIHHARGEGDAITTRIVSAGSLSLDPPGIQLVVGELFPAA